MSYLLHQQETLTGFKWMANKATELMAKGKTVLFAFEEAIGRAQLKLSGIKFLSRLAEFYDFL